MEHERIDWTGVETSRTRYKSSATIFAQGDLCATVLYMEQGTARMSVVSHAGKEAIVAVLEPGQFFGEGCMAGQPRRIATAVALTPCSVVQIQKQEMTRQILAKPTLAQHFLMHMLSRNIRIEEDLIDQLFNDAEKRLARTLLLMARYGEEQPSHRILPKVSQTILAEMIGTTRSRVNAFMNKFRKLGFIEYNGTLKVNNSLVAVLLREAPPRSPAPARPGGDASVRHRHRYAELSSIPAMFDRGGGDGKTRGPPDPPGRADSRDGAQRIRWRRRWQWLRGPGHSATACRSITTAHPHPSAAE